MKSTPAKRKISGKAAPGAAVESSTLSGADDQLNWIATAAYFKAEARDFAPGQELDDWLRAELEFHETAGH